VRSLAYDYPIGHVIPRHQHDWHQLVYAVTGVMTVMTDQGAWVVPTHRGVWVPAFVDHSIRMSGKVSMRTLYLRPRRRATLPTGCEVLDVSPLMRELVLHVVELGHLDRAVPAHARLLAVLLDQLRLLPSRALHLPWPRDPRARRVAALLEAAPADRRTLAALAAGSGASPRTLQRLFQAETGMRFGTWQQHLRLGHALHLLAGGATVTEAALDSGYASVSAFVSLFRVTFGETPGRYFRREQA
jgi:AraC-like DNA-binding protein